MQDIKVNNPAQAKAHAIFVDLGGIFMHPNVGQKLGPNGTGIPLRRAMTSSIWMDYEIAKTKTYSFPVDNLTTLIHQLRETTQYDKKTVSIFRKVKDSSQVKIYLVSNISNPDYTALRNLWGEESWSLFDDVFISAMAGTRKPSLKFYRHILRVTGMQPQDTIYVDDAAENNLAAASVGIRPTFDISNLECVLANMLYSPIERGQQFLKKYAKQHYCTTQDGEIIEEVYAQLLILDATGDVDLVDIQRPTGLWNYFSGKPTHTSATYPADLDTTSLGLATLGCSSAEAHPILDEMLKFRNEDGIFEAYFDKPRPRVDAVIAISTLTFFYIHGRAYDAPETMDWIQNILFNRAYLHGTRYYPWAEWFLYYVYRLLTRTSDPVVHEKLKGPLQVRIAERIGADGDYFCLAVRLIVCNYVGIENIADREKLKSWQLEDGGWERSYMYLFPGAGKKVGNRGATTAFAIKALQGVSESDV